MFVIKRSKVPGSKRKLNTRKISEKYKMLKEIEKGETSATIPKKYDIGSLIFSVNRTFSKIGLAESWA